ncbi:MAG: hypothetical protein E7540_03270 [Ruminococcaceae bacterium]|nr:hypothetical protein [Oscillospiraceae bacterium]
MNNNSCSCRFGCTFWAVVASVIVGVVTAFLQITGTITVAPVFSWVFFGIAVLFLVVLTGFVLVGNGDGTCCQPCTALAALLIGALGTVIASLVILAFAFVATSIVGAVVLGIELLFFTLTLTSSACVINCLFGCQN